MTKLIASRGLDAWSFGDTGLMIGSRTESRSDVSLAFCSDSLSIYSRNINFNSDYIATLEDFIARYGQPRIRVTRQVFSGTGGGYVQTSEMVWYKNNERIRLLVSPESRDGKGNLRFRTLASFDISTKNSCIGDKYYFFQKE